MSNHDDTRAIVNRREFFRTAGAGITAAGVLLTPREAAIAQAQGEKD